MKKRELKARVTELEKRVELLTGAYFQTLAEECRERARSKGGWERSRRS